MLTQQHLNTGVENSVYRNVWQRTASPCGLTPLRQQHTLWHWSYYEHISNLAAFHLKSCCHTLTPHICNKLFVFVVVIWTSRDDPPFPKAGNQIGQQQPWQPPVPFTTKTIIGVGACDKAFYRSDRKPTRTMALVVEVILPSILSGGGAAVDAGSSRRPGSAATRPLQRLRRRPWYGSEAGCSRVPFIPGTSGSAVNGVFKSVQMLLNGIGAVIWY